MVGQGPPYADFNNMPQTTLADLHNVLQIARQRVIARLQAVTTP